MSEDIVQWLQDRGLKRYAEAFQENDIDLELLPTLTGDDLRDLGVTSVGHRRRIMNTLAELQVSKHNTVPSTDRVESDREKRPLPESTRRQVSVLFADLSGFTRLSSILDAEETHSLLNSFFATVGEVVSSYGGTVDKHIGDAVMAVFGAPVAHTDDPARALRAACDIHAALAALSPPLHVHIGVASGQVIASATGSAQHTEYTVTGDSVNLAARLTDLAETDQTFVSASIRRALGEGFVGENLGEKLIEGLPEPVLVWRLDRIIDQRETGRRPFVGRREERATFDAALTRCADEKTGAVYIVRGEAGIGKTRLIEEFERMAGARGFATHTGLVLDFGTAKGQDAVRALTRSLLGIAPNSGKRRRAEAAEQAFASGTLSEERRAYLNDLLDLDQTPALRGLYDAMNNATRNAGKQATLAALAKVASRERPLLLKIEDLHWAGPIVLAHSAWLARITIEAPVILLMTTRLTGDPFGDEWRAQCSGVSPIPLTLEPMPQADADELARSFEDIDEDILRTCVDRSGGNPLLLEQLLYNADEVGAGELPGSVQTIVQARLDALPTNERHALQAAAALGQRFSSDAVEAMTAGKSFLPDTLIGHSLIRPAGNDFHFAHALVREGVYESLLRSQRADLHRRAAEYFRDRDPDLHAQHLDKAGDPEAPVAYLTAARLQRERLRLDAALGAATRALEIDTPRTPRFELACFRGDLLRDLGRSEESLEAFEMGLGLAKDDGDLCRANLGLAAAMRVVDRIEEAFACLDRAHEIAESDNMNVELAEIHFQRGNLFFPLGQLAECRTEHEESLRHARMAGSEEAEARALGGLGDAFFVLGQMRTAQGYFERAIEIAERNGLRRIEVVNLPMTGWTAMFMGDLDRAEKIAHEAIEMAKAISESRARIIAHNLLIQSSALRGDFDATLLHAEYGAALAREIGATRFLQNLYIGAGMNRAFAKGDRTGASSLIKDGFEISQQTGEAFMGPWLLGLAMQFAGNAADRRWAKTEAERILGAGAVGHNYLFFYVEAMEACRETGEWDEALRYANALEEFTSEEPLEWSDYFIHRTRALAAVALGDRDRASIGDLKTVRKIGENLGFNFSLQSIDEAIAKAGG